MLAYLKALGWDKKPEEFVIDSADRCFKSLSAKLGQNK